MDCTNCELKQRQFFCENCLRTHLRDFRHQTQHFASDRQEQVAKASKALETIEPARIRRATLADYQTRVDEVMSGLTRLRKENDKKRDRLRSLRESLAARRRTLSFAKLLPHAAPNPTNYTASREAQELSALSVTLARARSGLVQELVEVFNVVEVGGRPPIGGKAGTKGEWTIGDLILPVPGDIRRYPPDHINAVITHTIHFLSLLTFYLGIKLPFEVSWSGGKLGVGQPSISAGKGGESGGWARWYTKHPLHLSSSPNPSSPTPSSPTLSSLNPSSSSQPQSRSRSQGKAEKSHSIPHHVPVSESYIEPDPTPQASFTTALTMLLYNVCYLAWTQGVDVPLSQAGDVLSNLWSVCCSSELGRKSHETTPALSPPTPPTFPLDFQQLLQATTANPASRVRPRSSKRRTSGTGTTGTGTGKKHERIIEEDEGWDLVDGDADADGFEDEL
ncbi:hypothetical protein Hypma_004562 [Hypsizygus marmoreus]|uniref:Autophagy-related protein 14 n=1 Tax=Hypsizygus marmoreus TaxID=39966 RepID=A0A369K102_HYPMA|nr:hypothetical protein Hypma_004562 [Hypsizygus marmoreus]